MPYLIIFGFPVGPMEPQEAHGPRVAIDALPPGPPLGPMGTGPWGPMGPLGWWWLGWLLQSGAVEPELLCTARAPPARGQRQPPSQRHAPARDNAPSYVPDWKISQDVGLCQDDIILAESQHPGQTGRLAFTHASQAQNPK